MARVRSSEDGDFGALDPSPLAGSLTVDSPHGPEAAHDRTADRGPHARAIVLYIEDNSTIVRLVEHILRRNPRVALMSAARGQLGLELARSHRPDLILLDLDLPDMTGETVAAALKHDPATRAIPIVVLTGAADESQLRLLVEHGATAYLTKPFKIADILALVERFAGTQPSPQQ